MIIITILEGTSKGHLSHPLLIAGSTSKLDEVVQSHIQLRPAAVFSVSGLLDNMVYAPKDLMLLLCAFFFFFTLW